MSVLQWYAVVACLVMPAALSHFYLNSFSGELRVADVAASFWLAVLWPLAVPAGIGYCLWQLYLGTLDLLDIKRPKRFRR